MVNTDGTSYRTFDFSDATLTLADFKVDSRNGRIYFVDESQSKIYVSTLEGALLSSLDTLSANAQSISGDLSLRKLFWWEDDGNIVAGHLSEKKLFDNGFVNHEIPQADLRYAWINASALTTETQLPGHQNSSSAPFGPYDDIEYTLSLSSAYRVESRFLFIPNLSRIFWFVKVAISFERVYLTEEVNCIWESKLGRTNNVCSAGRESSLITGSLKFVIPSLLFEETWRSRLFLTVFGVLARDKMLSLTSCLTTGF